MSLYNEVKQIIDEHDIGEQLMYEENYSEEFNAKNISIEQVEHHGGEDEGSSFWTVWKFEKDNEVEYLEFYGYYASFAGAEYEDYQRVAPKEVTVTKYLPI